MATLMCSSVAGLLRGIIRRRVCPRFFGIGARVERAESALSNPLGIVNGAVFSDLDRRLPGVDRYNRVGGGSRFKNIEGRFDEMTEALGLSGLTGLWQGVAIRFQRGRVDGYRGNQLGAKLGTRPDVLNPPRLYFNYSESSVPTSLLLTLG